MTMTDDSPCASDTGADDQNIADRRGPRHRTAPARTFRRFLLDVAVTGRWVLWADFVAEAWHWKSGGRPSLAALSTWRLVRRFVAAELAALELVADVWSSADARPLEDHNGSHAGYVRIRLAGRDEVWAPADAVDAHELAYRRRMLDVHGLTPAPGVECTLRGFLGQHAEYAKPPWLDHARAWTDEDGEPVLTVEPYAFDARRVVRDVGDLPLVLDGPHPGVWNDGTDLLLWRWGVGDPLLAVHEPARRRAPEVTPLDRATLRWFLGPLPGGRLWAEVSDSEAAELLATVDMLAGASDAGELVERLNTALRAAAARLKADLPELLNPGGLVAAAIAGPASERELRVWWLARKLAGHVLAGHLEPEPAAQLLAGVLAHTGKGHDIAFARRHLHSARVTAFRSILCDAQAEVREALGDDWYERVAAQEVFAKALRSTPGLRLTFDWLGTVLTQEMYGG